MKSLHKFLGKGGKRVEIEPQSLAAEYVRLQDEMNTLHDGRALREAAGIVLEQLPDGPVALYSTSDQGAGLAAACAALRDEETVWRRIHVAYPPAAPEGHAVVIVEAIAGGAAWVQSLTAIYPQARVITTNSRLPAPARAA